jgi:hypothetical protein
LSEAFWASQEAVREAAVSSWLELEAAMRTSWIAAKVAEAKSGQIWRFGSDSIRGMIGDGWEKRSGD